jgi:hypothetical protein
MTSPRHLAWLAFAVLLAAVPASAQSFALVGSVRDETGGALPGVSVELRAGSSATRYAETDARGGYRFDAVTPGRVQVSFALANFARARREAVVPTAGGARVDAVMSLSLSADVTVSGKSTFTNLADAPEPARSLVGVAQSASQGAITARQLEARPLMRTGEVLETVPGVVISQHSGEGKANQYYLRGFNLDHGTDFATTVAGMPVNMPTHGHGHGYSDLNFLIPELVSGVQFSKGPYFAEQGDFATAGAANINYANRLGRPVARLEGGGQGFRRVMAAGSSAIGNGYLLAALDAGANDGPWDRPDEARRLSGVVRYSRGDASNGFVASVMGYQSKWHATDQVPDRAVAAGLIGRFGAIDDSDGGDSYRYSGSVEWQRTGGSATTKVSAFGIGYGLDLFSNFTYFLDDPEQGDQFQQTDRRFITGAKLNHRRLGHWAGRPMQNTATFQFRHDDITDIGLHHTQARRRLNTVREDAVRQTSAAASGQNEIEWSPWLRTIAGLRVDGYRFGVNAGEPLNAGTSRAALVSPKAGAVFGPWRGTELYANAGTGFHSNDARGATITIDPVTRTPVDRVTPLVRAYGAEVGLRTVAIPRLQTTVTLWTLRLESELLFVGDAGTTTAGRPSRRAGIEIANYFSPRPWLTVDADLSLSRARFTDRDPAGDTVPGAVSAVVSAGATLGQVRSRFASVRWRYLGPRALTESNEMRSSASSMVNIKAGQRLFGTTRLELDVFNLLNAKDSDIDYFYTSRLPGEPAGGFDDFHSHPALPRSARLSLIIGF